MGQHLYECERCHKHGVAHYVLVKDETAPLGWRNELICTTCWRESKKQKEDAAA